MYIDLNPLLLKQSLAKYSSTAARRTVSGGGEDQQQQQQHQIRVQQHKAGGAMMTGWLPIYDTMHGIRGEVRKSP